MLDGGVCGTIEELARRENVNRGYMNRALRLTLLAPDHVEAILDGGQPEALRLEDLLKGFPFELVRPRLASTAELRSAARSIRGRHASGGFGT